MENKNLKSMSPSVRLRIMQNIFPAALAAIESWEDFPWHCDNAGVNQTYKPHSSQALAIDVFGTLKSCCQETRDKVMKYIASHLRLPTEGPWRIELEWSDPKNVLSEKRQTQVDAASFSPHAVILFESKFAEAKPGGGCSQTQPLMSGPQRGCCQCNGTYTTQVNPINGITSKCSLSGKGIGYWKYMQRLFNLDASIDYVPCPFAGSTFQWMRNVVLSYGVSQYMGLQAGFVLAFVDDSALPTALAVREEIWRNFREKACTGPVKIDAISIQQILHGGMDKAVESTIIHDLSEWINVKIKSYSAQK